jgi:hypothetical protein
MAVRVPHEWVFRGGRKVVVRGDEKKISWLVAVGISLVGLTGEVRAESSKTHTYRVDGNHKNSVYIVTRQVVAPSAVVSRELREQPVYTDLIELKVVNTTIMIDPDEDYIHQSTNAIDDKQFIPTAQRLYRSLTAKKAHVIWGKESTKRDAHALDIQPIMIIRPDFKNDGSSPRMEKTPDSMEPSAPVKSKMNPLLVMMEGGAQ